MIDLDLTVRYEELEAAILALAESTEPEALVEPLLRTGGLVRGDARRHFDQGGPGWKPLADSTKTRKPNEAMIALVRDSGRGTHGKDRSAVQRIARDAATAEKWGDRVEALNDRIATARAKGRKTATMQTRRDKAYEQRRKAVERIYSYRRLGEAAGVEANELIDFARREVMRAKAHGRIQRAVKQLERAGIHMTEDEKRKMKSQHQRRFIASEHSTKILGNLAESIGVAIVREDDGGKVVTFSRAKIGKVHNDGGIAGHGAKIEARRYLYLEEKHLEFLRGLLEQQMIDAFDEAE